MTKVEGEPMSASELCFPGWGQQCRLSSGLPSQPASLVAQQGSAPVSRAFTQQEPGCNWVVYSGASKLEDDVFWSLKCLEESLSFRLCVDFSAVACTLISLCLLCTPANCYAFICFVPRSYHFPLIKCFFFILVVYFENIWPFQSCPIRTSEELHLCSCVLGDGVKSLAKAVLHRWRAVGDMVIRK